MLINRMCLLLCLTVILTLTTACNTENMEDAMREVISTDLLSESIDDIKVSMSINDETLIRKHGQFEPHPDNEYYARKRNTDQYRNKDIILSVDRETKEILQVGVLEDNDTSSSAKGIKLGIPIEEVISAYGEDYFTFEDREQTIYIIGYVDHQNNLELSFVHFDGKVIGISFGYAFDRIKWGKQ
ncbi:hypothetical protein [Sutcliffiella halmapala]|uniref:hypothetical protein n=1 Tax=Sutcliffiella halmapala TaxID=79882 RepID=UPI0011179BF2|nr:hypothetical protein [Sutcliffiella halmapala]